MPPEAETARVRFSPSGLQGPVAHGATVLDAARTLGVDLDSVCGGRSICGRCQVEPVSGPVTDESPDEAQCRTRKGMAQGRRLGCRSHILGDVVIDVPPESQLHRQVILLADATDLTIDPVTRLHYVSVAPARLEAPGGVVERVIAALAAEWQLPDLSVHPAAVGVIQKAVGEGRGAGTAAVRDGTVVVGAWPGFHDRQAAVGGAADE